MANPILTKRVQDYFRRQLALYEDMLAAHDAFQRDLDAGHLDHLAERQESQSKQAAMLEREFRALLREWQAAPDLDEGERAEVRDLAERAQTLAGRVVERNQQIIRELQRRTATLQNDANALHRGLGLLKMYRPGISHVAGFLSKKA